jgi:putative lipoprotein (rSAM/lipoprotein system)
MKIDRRAFIKKSNWALAGIIGMLGFAGCKKNDGKDNGEDSGDDSGNDNGENGGDDSGRKNGEEIPLMYGTPYANFTVKGAVVSAATGKPIAGIRVVVPRVDHHQRATATFIPGQRIITREVNDTTYTNDNGLFEFKYQGIQTNDSTNIIMKFEDIAKNFKADSAKITFLPSDLKDENGWYQGSATKEVSIKLSD